MSSMAMDSFVSISDLPEDAGFSTFLWHIYSKKKYIDIYFNVEYEKTQTTFSAHKLVLALKSPYFAEEFYGNEKKIVNVIPLSDINPEAFKAMLNYMYDYTPPIKTPKMACEIYKLAEEFQVFTLMKLCRNSLNNMKMLSSNIFDLLEASDYLHDTRTKNACLKFIQENTKEVMASYKFSEISPSIISIILELKVMSLDSVLDLFNWVFEWAKSQMFGNVTIRNVVEEFLPQLPFSSLSDKQFAELYKRYRDVFEDDEIISIFMNLALPMSDRFPDWYNEKCTLEMKPKASE